MLYAATCPDTVTIIMPDGPSYTAGDEMTCSSDGYPDPTYTWTVDGDPGSTTSIQVIEEGEHVYECKVTVTINETECSNATTVTETGYSKYQKQYILLLQLY